MMDSAVATISSAAGNTRVEYRSYNNLSDTGPHNQELTGDAVATISSAAGNTCVEYRSYNNLSDTGPHNQKLSGDYENSGGYQQQRYRGGRFPWIIPKSYCFACVALLFIITLIIGCTIVVKNSNSSDDGSHGLNDTHSDIEISDYLQATQITVIHQETSMPSDSTGHIMSTVSTNSLTGIYEETSMSSDSTGHIMSTVSTSSLTETYEETIINEEANILMPSFSTSPSIPSSITSNSLGTYKGTSMPSVSTRSSTIRSSERYKEIGMSPVSTRNSVPLISVTPHNGTSMSILSVSASNSNPSNSTSTSNPSTSTSNSNPSNSTSTINPSTILSSSSERYEESKIPFASTTSSVPSSSTSASSERRYEGTSISSVSTNINEHSNNSSTSLYQTNSSDTNNITETEVYKSRLFSVTIEKLLKHLPCEPRPVKLPVQQAIGNDTKNSLLDYHFYPNVIVVMLCDRTNSYCGNENGRGDSSRKCMSYHNETRTHTVKYLDPYMNNLVYHSIDIAEDVQCKCMDI